MKNWKTGVLFGVNMVHFTQRCNCGNEWISDIKNWHTTFFDQLPQSTDDINTPKRTKNGIAQNCLYGLHTENFSFRHKWKWILASRTWQQPAAWSYLGLFVFGKSNSKKR